jgi:hypothetical protein
VVFIRFRLEKANFETETQELAGTWIVGDPTTERYFMRSGRWPDRRNQEIWAPAAAVRPDGTLVLVYHNAQPDTSVVFPMEDGLEVLQKTGPFWPNLYRALLVIGLYLALLAAIGVVTGALFSFPVAALVAFALFTMGLLSPWFMTVSQEPGGYTLFRTTPQIIGQAPTVGQAAGTMANRVFQGVLGVVVSVLPGFGHYNPVEDLVTGRMVSWALLARAAFWFLVVRGGLVALVGIWLFKRKEIARVQV